MSDALPEFPYHPDPVATGSVERSQATCRACGRARGFIYTGPVYAIEELDDSFCPWCIANGSAAGKFDAEFTDVGIGVPDDVPSDVLDAVARRTPGFMGWQQEHWLYHCGDAAAFLGRAGRTELDPYPDALEMIREETGLAGDDAEEYLDALDKDGAPTAYLFRCRVCGAHVAYSDTD